VIAVLRTWWHVGLESYAEDNGIDLADVPREFCYYVTASVTDIPPLAEAEGYAYDVGQTHRQVIDGRAHMSLAWRLDVDRAAWAAVRGLDPRAGVRRDLVERMAFELFHLGSLCETDVVMTARYSVGDGPEERVWCPQDRRRASLTS
jgi:hypothetical protein